MFDIRKPDFSLYLADSLSAFYFYSIDWILGLLFCTISIACGLLYQITGIIHMMLPMVGVFAFLIIQILFDVEGHAMIRQS